MAQGRSDCGLIQKDFRADLVLVDTGAAHFVPNNDPLCDLVYCAGGSDVSLTMADGKILYKDGEFLTLDIEKVKHNAKEAAKTLF